MNRLGFRANVQHRVIRDKSLLLYEDHRYSLYVLWHARYVARMLSEPVILLYFDHHDDFHCPSESALSTIARFRAQPPGEREFLQFVEWDLNFQDADWLVAGFELGLIEHAVLFGGGDVKNLTACRFQHVDSSAFCHRTWHVGHLWDALAPGGALSPDGSETPATSLWTALGWKPEYAWLTDDHPPFVLDFDLDCFSDFDAEPRRAWPVEDFRSRFFQTIQGGKGRSAGEVLTILADNAAYISVARESAWCGGTEQSQLSLRNLLTVLADGHEDAVGVV